MDPERPEGKIPDIKADELLSVIKGLVFETGEEFEYNGTSFILVITTSEDTEKGGYTEEQLGEEAEYHRSTLIDGYDIYLRGDELERKAFHEIMEANLVYQGFDAEDAHKIAQSEEEKVYGKRKK